ncbi:hypothetical protein HG530_009098 [Fusarium avenaceum]|nr:hypothetical protein HG530_009098 [Fusarium avenaceum]
MNIIVGERQLLLVRLSGLLVLHLGNPSTLSLVGGLLGLRLFAVIFVVILIVVAVEPFLEFAKLLVALANVGDVLDLVLEVVFLFLAPVDFLVVLVETLVHVNVTLTLAFALHAVEDLLPDSLADVEGLIAVGTLSETLDKLALDGSLQLGSCLGLALTSLLTVPDLRRHLGHKLFAQAFLLGGDTAHASLDLGQTGKALLALVDQVLGPVEQKLVNLLQRLRIVLAELALLP